MRWLAAWLRGWRLAAGLGRVTVVGQLAAELPAGWLSWLGAVRWVAAQMRGWRPWERLPAGLGRVPVVGQLSGGLGAWLSTVQWLPTGLSRPPGVRLAARRCIVLRVASRAIAARRQGWLTALQHSAGVLRGGSSRLLRRRRLATRAWAWAGRR